MVRPGEVPLRSGDWDGFYFLEYLIFGSCLVSYALFKSPIASLLTRMLSTSLPEKSDSNSMSLVELLSM